MRVALEQRLRRAPRPVRWAAERVSPLYDFASVRRYRARTGETMMPVPPVRMRAAVGLGMDIDWYVESGREVSRHIREEVKRLGSRFEELESALDFACGCGRVLQHLRGLGPRLTGCDVDSRAVGWMERNVRPDRAVVSGPHPPLPFADDSFDLVYAISAFTHFQESDQDLWLEEVGRILRPGGIFLATTNGPISLRKFLTRNEIPRDLGQRLQRRHLEREGFVFERYLSSVASTAAHVNTSEKYGLTFHDPQYVFAHWGERFEVADIHSGSTNVGQDLVVARLPA